MINLNVKKEKDWAISSQVSKELDKGSTHSVHAPERSMKRQECGELALPLIKIYADLQGNLQK